MSVRTMARVWDLSTHSGSNLLLMLAIADFADDEGRAYPSVSTLAKKCRIKPRNANYILAALQSSGELKVKIGGGPSGSTNRYHITLHAQPLQPAAPLQVIAPLHPTAPVQPAAPLQPGACTPAPQCSLPLHPSADKPSVNHQEPSDISLTPKLKKRKPHTLAEFLADCRTSGAKAIPDDDQIFKYAETIGLQTAMLEASWSEFKASHIDKPKTYADWRAAFRNSVRGNWYRIWFLTDGEAAKWTTQGEQARRAVGSLEAMP